MQLADLYEGMRVICGDFEDIIVKLHPENDITEDSGNPDWGYTVELKEQGMQSHTGLERIISPFKSE